MHSVTPSSPASSHLPSYFSLQHSSLLSSHILLSPLSSSLLLQLIEVHTIDGVEALDRNKGSMCSGTSKAFNTGKRPSFMIDVAWLFLTRGSTTQRRLSSKARIRYMIKIRGEKRRMEEGEVEEGRGGWYLFLSVCAELYITITFRGLERV